MADFNQHIYDTLTPTERQLYIRFGHVLELTMDQLAEYMGYNNKRTLHTLVSMGTFQIPTYRRGRYRYASLKHVAQHRDGLESEAVQKLGEDLALLNPKARKDVLARYAGINDKEVGPSKQLPGQRARVA